MMRLGEATAFASIAVGAVGWPPVGTTMAGNTMRLPVSRSEIRVKVGALALGVAISPQCAPAGEEARA